MPRLRDCGGDRQERTLLVSGERPRRKTVVGSCFDPLLHMIRTGDHGIDPPPELSRMTVSPRR